MVRSRRAGPRVPVRIDPGVWEEEVERFDERSSARIVVERERAALERDGIAVENLLACEEDEPGRTELAGLVKVYLPIGKGPASERPYGLVLAPGRDEAGVYLALVAFGVRHPRDRSRSVYERAHRRLHGRYPDQG